jgi:hypothetical protein
MDDASLCETVCRESGWLGELVVVLLFALRAVWVQRQRRAAEAERDSLQEKVRELSLRPPAAPQVTLQLAAHPSLASLVPVAVPTPSKPPSSPPESDPDMVDPPPE